MAYDPKLKEEEIKNKVAADLFADYDCTRILGHVDFCVQPKDQGPTLWETESLLWAEAKNEVYADIAPLFAQLVLTVGGEKTFEKHSPPPFLGAFDSEKIAFLPWHVALDLFFRSDIDWTATPSKWESPAFRHVLGLVRPILDANLVSFPFGDPDLLRFVKRNLLVGNERTNRLHVTRNNFPFVYQKWVRTVKPSIAVDWALARKQGIHDADFFLADLLSKDNATLMQKLFVVLRGNHYLADRQLDPSGFFTEKRVDFKDGQKAHAQFWNQYRRPPRKEFWSFINERRDLLMPPDIRERQGSFFTPQIWVEKAQEAIAAVLGEDWQDDHYVWDCAAGTGNLLAGLDPKAKYRVWASTLQKGDVDIMHERIANGAALLDSHVFQFDFLNGSFDDLPNGLRDIINDPEKRRKLVVFINPPYAEADNRKGEGRSGVATTMIREKYADKMGYAKRELFIQFATRIDQEIRGCIIAKFGTPKDVAAPKFTVFREFFNPKLLSMFLVPAWTFDNVKGRFPIAFSIWDTSCREKIDIAEAEVFNADGNSAGKKTLVCYDGKKVINDWVLTFEEKAATSIGTMMAIATDFQNQQLCRLEPPNRPWNHQFQWQVTRNNLVQSCIYFAVRHCIEADWINHYDQFLLPSDSWKTDRAFQLDCLVFTLFHGKNRISCRGAGGSPARSVGPDSAGGPPTPPVNHWIPFTEDEVGASDSFVSHFMSDWLRGKKSGASTPCEPSQTTMAFDNEPLAADVSQSPYDAPIDALSPAARAVFNAGRELWRYYHAQTGALPDASLYDIRAHFQGFKPNGHMNPDSADEGYSERIATLRSTLKALAAQIAPKVFEHGFLRG